MSSRWLSLQVACVYIGTVVGAGFASGREIYEFFSKYGVIAYAAIVLVTVLFAWLGYRLMALGAALHANSFRDVNAHMFGPRLRRVMDIVLLVMLFGTTVAMLAGTGELFRERLGQPFTIGVVAAIVITLCTLMFGMNGLLKVNSVIVPTLAIFVIYTTVHTWLHTEPTVQSILHPASLSTQFGFPVWISALLYAAMNTGLSVGVLVPLGGQVQDRKALKRGAIMGAAGLGAMLVAVTFSLFAYMPDVTAYAIPMAFIASHFSPWLSILFIAVLFGEIYSTLIGNVYAITASLASSHRQMLVVSVVLLVLAGVLSHFGFRAIVTYAYTGFGWISLCFILMIAMSKPQLPRV